VLDRGPYREHLTLGALPRDTGLVSATQTVLEIPDWQPNRVAHEFGPLEGFRLSGFRFQVPDAERWTNMTVWRRPSGLVVEDCSFARVGADPSSPPCSPIELKFDPSEREAAPIFVRQCLFDGGSVSILKQELANGTVVVEHNLFLNAHVGLGAKTLDTVVVRHNVFDNQTVGAFWIDGVSAVRGRLEIVNNTATKTILNSGVYFQTSAPPTNVVIRNCNTDSGVAIDHNVPNARTAAAKNWQM
jgi:hypothetical protein